MDFHENIKPILNASSEAYLSPTLQIRATDLQEEE